jgi:DNA-binding MarR family transcriptional regulator
MGGRDELIDNTGSSDHARSSDDGASSERAELIARVERAESQLRASAVRKGATDLFSIDLTMQQLRMLFILAASGALSAHDLAEALGVGPTTLTGIVDRVEARSLVRRLPDSLDRRVKRIDLTDHGRRLLNDLHEVSRDFHRQLLARLDMAELAGLATGFEALARACEEDGMESAPVSGRR